MTNETPHVVPENIPSASSLIPSSESPTVPWSLRDTWIGFGIFVLCMVGIGLSPLLLPDQGWFLSLWILVYQPLQFTPILVVLLMRGATWNDVGFRRAQPNVLALGCGLVLGALVVNVVNNAIMLLLGIEVQAQQVSSVFDMLDNPALFLITGILLAPLFEETIFRGFLFGGLRKQLGWLNAALISSAIFGASHLSIAAFIPTFTLGFLFSYLYQRSKSIWPGIILHTLINSVGLCALYVMKDYMGPLSPFGMLLWR